MTHPSPGNEIVRQDVKDRQEAAEQETPPSTGEGEEQQPGARDLSELKAVKGGT